jgi:hypothetical protein
VGGKFVIATTDWDLAIDAEFNSIAYYIRSADDYENYNKLASKPITIVKLHGDFKNNSEIVLTRREAQEQQNKNEKKYMHVFGTCVGKQVVMLGYSARDSDFIFWAEKVKTSVDFAVVLKQDELHFRVQEPPVEKNIIEFLRQEALSALLLGK